MRHARLLSVAILSLVLVSACTTASAGWTYVPAPSMTPIPSGAPSAEPSGSGDDNVVQISALGIKYEQSAVTVKAGISFQIAFDNKDAGTPHNVSIHQGERDRRGAVQGRDLQRGRDPHVHRPAARRGRLRVRVHRPSHDDWDAHRPVTPALAHDPVGRAAVLRRRLRATAEARVVAVEAGDPPLLVLDRTVFYPGGGGQPSDRGLVFRAVDGRSWTVRAARKVDGEIVHELEPGDADLAGRRRRRCAPTSTGRVASP